MPGRAAGEQLAALARRRNRCRPPARPPRRRGGAQLRRAAPVGMRAPHRRAMRSICAALVIGMMPGTIGTRDAGAPGALDEREVVGVVVEELRDDERRRRRRPWRADARGRAAEVAALLVALGVAGAGEAEAEAALADEARPARWRSRSRWPGGANVVSRRRVAAQRQHVLDAAARRGGRGCAAISSRVVADAGQCAIASMPCSRLIRVHDLDRLLARLPPAP